MNKERNRKKGFDILIEKHTSHNGAFKLAKIFDIENAGSIVGENGNINVDQMPAFYRQDTVIIVFQMPAFFWPNAGIIDG